MNEPDRDEIERMACEAWGHMYGSLATRAAVLEVMSQMLGDLKRRRQATELPDNVVPLH